MAKRAREQQVRRGEVARVEAHQEPKVCLCLPLEKRVTRLKPHWLHKTVFAPGSPKKCEFRTFASFVTQWENR